MRRFTGFIVSVLVALPLVMPLCAQAPAANVELQSRSPRVMIEALSDTKGLQLGPYLGTVIPELRRRFMDSVSAAQGNAAIQQEATVVLTIAPGGELSGLRLESEAQGSPIAQAVWNAAKDTAYAPLPTVLHGSTLTLRVHFIR